MPQHVRHAQFGVGQVIRFDPPNAVIDFPGVGRKLIRVSFLQPVDPNEPTPASTPVEKEPAPEQVARDVWEAVLRTERKEEVAEAVAARTQVPKSDDPPVRPRWKKEAATYGEWVRSMPPERLTRDEQRRMREERAWEADNRATVVQLDALVGIVCVLRRDMTTLANEAENAMYRVGPKSYPKGMRVRVFARTGACLLGRTIDGTVLRLKLDWIEPAPVVVPTKASILEEIAREIAEDATR